MAQAVLFHVRFQRIEETLAGFGFIAVYVQPRFHERTHQPRPHRSLMIRTVALARQPANTFNHAAAFPDDRFRAVVRPNADTLYSTAWLDLAAEPVLQDRLPGNWKTVGTIDDVIVSRREAPSLPPPP